MVRAYEIWKAYAMAVVDAVFAYLDKTDDWGWPPVLAMVLPLLPLLAVDRFVSRWVSLGLFLPVGLPIGWFVGSLFCAYLATEHGSYREVRRRR